MSCLVFLLGVCCVAYAEQSRPRVIPQPPVSLEPVPEITRLTVWQRAQNGTCRMRQVVCERRWAAAPTADEDICVPFDASHAIRPGFPQPSRLVYERERIGSLWQQAPMRFDVPSDSDEGNAIWALPPCVPATVQR